MREHELTVAQARVVASVRARHPRATLIFHEREWGLLLEVRQATPSGRTHTTALARFVDDGSIVPDRHLLPRAA